MLAPFWVCGRVFTNLTKTGFCMLPDIRTSCQLDASGLLKRRLCSLLEKKAQSGVFLAQVAKLLSPDLNHHRLCNIHTSPPKRGQHSLSKWCLILQDYKKISQMVLCNGILRQPTTLQLVEVNQTTLIHWYSQRLKGQEVSVLLQDMQLPVARPVAGDPLPLAKTKPVSLPQYQHQPHTYHMPPRDGDPHPLLTTLHHLRRQCGCCCNVKPLMSIHLTNKLNL